jgi:type VI secretion system protein ImpJ
MSDAIHQVFWGQGAFLSPQHLQRQDAHHVDRDQRLQRLTHPFPWGFETLSFREDALSSGVVDVSRFVLWTRSGLRIEGGSSASGNGRVNERNLSEIAATSGTPIALYLVLSQDQAVAGLRRGDAARLPTRHYLETVSVEDPFDPQSPAVDVDLLRYQLSLVTSLDENLQAILQGSEAYKLAELLPNGPGRYKLSADYVPASVTLAASANLARWTHTFRDLLVSKGQDFSTIKRQRGIRAASTSAQEVMRVVMMQTFGRYIPALQEAVRLQQLSPYALYGRLRELVAEFSVFSEEVSYFGGLQDKPDTELPAYDHDDLRRCFQIAFSRAEQLIKALTVGAEVGIALTYDGRFYKAEIPPKLFESDKTRFYLAIESETKGMDLSQRLSRTGKICTIEEMPRLLQAALFGLKIDLLPVPPEELPQKTPNTTYFLIDTTHAFWTMIKQRRNIAISSDLPSESTVMKLYPVGADE